MPAAHFDVLVIGGGASGALMALHLEGNRAGLSIAVVERSAMLGCGIAYGSGDPDHLLNTRVHNMSAFADQPEHFLGWLRGPGNQPGATPDSFVARPLYGAYLASLLNGIAGNAPGAFPPGATTPKAGAPAFAAPHSDTISATPAPGDAATGMAAPAAQSPSAAGNTGRRVSCFQGECIRLSETPAGVLAELADGTRLSAGQAVLATGHATPATPASGLTSGWDFAAGADPDGHVVIIGTGLSMIDHVLSLLRRGHRGKITCLSRRALLPREHRPASALPLTETEVPFGQPVSRVLLWLRGVAREAERIGGTWRDAVDGVRPYVARLWQGWSLTERKRFLRHGAAWWEVHRHRMPPRSGSQLSQAMARGQLVIRKARFSGIDATGTPMTVRIVEAGEARSLTADQVIDCRGIRRDPAKDSVPVVRELLSRGAARLDPLELGLDTTLEARLVDAEGRISQRIFAIGPCARGTVWEITAIPDIRVQCAAVARLIAAGVA